MLPTPATDTAREALATIRRIADSPRTRRLDELEKLWKGEAWNDRPSFWDSTVPLNERGTCVQSSIAEASGGRLINLVFGNARFPSLEIGENAYGVEFSDDEKRALSKLAGAIVKQARLRPGMRQALEQGLMCGTLVAVGSLCMGRLRLQLLPAKYCEPTYGTDGALVSLEYRYRHDVMDDNGEPVTVWYRRVIDAKCDSVWDGVPTNPAGWLPDWREYTPKVVEHGLGFVPVKWHRNMPDVSDSDPLDGSPLFAGLEDEIFALDMAMSQRHRNGRYNGEPQIVRIGFGEQAKPMGDAGRTSEKTPGFTTWATGLVSRLAGGGNAATKKAPGTFWNAPTGADVKMVESSGAGATILAGDIDGLRQTILEARSIVMASPETIGANASAALLRQIFEPMLGVADNLREEYGPLLCEILDMLARIAYVSARKSVGVYLLGLRNAMSALDKCWAQVDAGNGTQRSEWIGLPLDLSWGEYFEPTWADVKAAVDAASSGNGDAPILTVEQSVRLVAPVLGIKDVDAYLVKLTGQTGADHAAASELLNGVLGQPAPIAQEQPVADAAMNGAQVTSLQAIVTAAAAGELPVETARGIILAAFPLLTAPQVEAIIAPLGKVAGIAQAHAQLQQDHAALKASHASKSTMLTNVLAENKAGRLVTGSPVGIPKVADASAPAGDVTE